MLPETLPTVSHDPSLRWSISVESASTVADRPAAMTTSVPVGCCNRGRAHRSTTARTATRTAAIHKIRGPGLRRGSALCDLQRRTAITSGDAIDVGGAHVRHLRAFDLDHVLRVALSAVREIEAAYVNVVVRDQDLGVHEIVDSALGVRGGPLGSEPRRADDGVK